MYALSDGQHLAKVSALRDTLDPAPVVRAGDLIVVSDRGGAIS